MHKHIESTYVDSIFATTFNIFEAHTFFTESTIYTTTQTGFSRLRFPYKRSVAKYTSRSCKDVRAKRYSTR